MACDKPLSIDNVSSQPRITVRGTISGTPYSEVNRV